MYRLSAITAIVAFLLANTPASAAQVGALSSGAGSAMRLTTSVGADRIDQGKMASTKGSLGQPVVPSLSVSTALSTALGVGGSDPASLRGASVTTSDALTPDGRGAGVRPNTLPTVQTAIGVAVSIGGNAASGARDTMNGGAAAGH